MANRYFSLTWSDLSYEAQENIKKSVKESLMAEYETMGTGAMLQAWHVEPKTWQEAYCRECAVDSSMWSDLDEKSPEFQAIDWKQTLEDYADEQAELKAVTGMKYVELEVTL